MIVETLCFYFARQIPPSPSFLFLWENSTAKKIQPSIKIKPSFVISWKTMAVDTGIGQGQCCVTAAMVNTWLFLPPITHILFSHLQHQSLQQYQTARKTSISSIDAEQRSQYYSCVLASDSPIDQELSALAQTLQPAPANLSGA